MHKMQLFRVKFVNFFAITFGFILLFVSMYGRKESFCLAKGSLENIHIAFSYFCLLLYIFFCVLVFLWLVQLVSLNDYNIINFHTEIRMRIHNMGIYKVSREKMKVK